MIRKVGPKEEGAKQDEAYIKAKSDDFPTGYHDLEISICHIAYLYSTTIM